jgi:hypothetical protein
VNVEVEGIGEETVMSFQSCSDNPQEEDGIPFDEMGR